MIEKGVIVDEFPVIGFSEDGIKYVWGKDSRHFLIYLKNHLESVLQKDLVDVSYKLDPDRVTLVEVFMTLLDEMLHGVYKSPLISTVAVPLLSLLEETGLDLYKRYRLAIITPNLLCAIDRKLGEL